MSKNERGNNNYSLSPFISAYSCSNLTPIHQDRDIQFRSGWSSQGLIIDWHENIPVVPPIEKTPISKKVMFTTFAGVGSIVGEAAFEAGFDVSLPTPMIAASVITALAGEGVIATNYVSDSVKRLRGIKERKRITAEAKRLQPEHETERIIERGANYIDCILLENIPYSYGGPQTESLLQTDIAIPGTTTEVPTVAVIAEYQKLDRDLNKSVSRKMGVKPTAASVEIVPSKKGGPQLKFNPAQGVARLLHAMTAKESSNLLAGSIENVEDIYRSQGRLANLLLQIKMSNNAMIRPTDAEQENLRRTTSDCFVQMAQQFLGIGALYMAMQPSFRHTAIEN